MQTTTISDLPTSVQFDFTTGDFAPFQELTDRRMSHLKEMFHDQAAVQKSWQLITGLSRDSLSSLRYQHLGYVPGGDAHLPGQSG